MDFGAGPPPQPLYPNCIGSQARQKTATKNQFNFDIAVTVKWPTNVLGAGQGQENETSHGTQCPCDRPGMRRVQDQMTEIERRCVRSIAQDADYCFLVSRRIPAAHVLDIRIACCLRESISANAMNKQLHRIILSAMTQGLDADSDAKQHINISTRPLETHHLFESHQAAAVIAGENDGRQVHVLLSRYPLQLVGQRIGSESCERSIPSATIDCKAFEIRITFPISGDSDLQAPLKCIQDVLTKATTNCLIVSEACGPLASVVCACTYEKASTPKKLQKQKYQSIRNRLSALSIDPAWVSVDAMVDHTIFHAFRENISGATVLHYR
jgi:hypothetical protein